MRKKWQSEIWTIFGLCCSSQGHLELLVLLLLFDCELVLGFSPMLGSVGWAAREVFSSRNPGWSSMFQLKLVSIQLYFSLKELPGVGRGPQRAHSSAHCGKAEICMQPFWYRHQTIGLGHSWSSQFLKGKYGVTTTALCVGWGDTVAKGNLRLQLAQGGQGPFKREGTYLLWIPFNLT